MHATDWRRPLLVVDVEGNGANPPDLVEVAAVPVVAGQPQPQQARQWLIRPPVLFPARMTRIHGITNEMATEAPAWADVAEEVGGMLEGAWIAAHSANVECKVLSRHLPSWQPEGVVDTLRLAKATYPEGKGYGLDALLARLQVDLSAVPGQRHRARYDAHATAPLLAELAAHYDTWDAMAAKAVPPGMPGLPDPEPAENTLW